MGRKMHPAKVEALAKGESTYFTGVPCIRGHVDVRYVGTSKCKSCDSLKHKLRRDNNPAFAARARQRHADWRAANRDYTLEKKRQYYLENREHAMALSLLWIKNNRDAVNAIRRRYYANSDKPLAYNKARLKRVKQATPPWADMEAIREFYRNCPKDMQVDHIAPLKGELICGLHVVANLQYLPIAENAAKSNHWDSRWVEGLEDVALFLFTPIHANGDQQQGR